MLPERFIMRPYKGLARYKYSDAYLFAGREAEIKVCAGKLWEGDEKLLLLHGMSGCGKSSFLQAGLIPYLEQFISSSESIGKPILEPAHGVSPNEDSDFVIRLGQHPIKTLAAAVARLADHLNIKPDILKSNSAEQFVTIAGSDSDLLIETLSEITLKLPFDKQLLLVIDQAEDIFGHTEEPESEQQRYFDFLAQITYEAVYLKVIVALRSEYKARFDDLLIESRADYSYVTTYYLDEIQDDGIIAAIKHPTKLPGCDFSYEERLPETILEDIRETRKTQAALPVLQVICDRLYCHWKQRNKSDKITEADYRASGASSAQIQSHVEEKLVEYFLKHKDECEVNLAEQADHWQSLLMKLAHSSTDGRVRARVSVPLDEIEMWAKDYQCEAVSGMLDWLSHEDRYVLEKVDGDALAGEVAPGWRLLHDTIAGAMVALKHDWCLRTGHWEGGAILKTLETPTLNSTDLYAAEDCPEPMIFRTINDLIWDHLIQIYAGYKGFSSRLGLQFEVDPAFDLTRPCSQRDFFEDFLKKANESGTGRLLAVLPGSVFPRIQEPPWLTIGIPNIYQGYSIFGRKQEGLEPLRQRRADSSHWHMQYTEMNQHRLRRIAKALSKDSVKIIAYENESDLFLRHILRLADCKYCNNVQVITKPSVAMQGATDLMFKALVDREADFVLGPAPSRALAQQAGFELFADFQSVYDLTSAEDKPELDDLRLHENWVTNIPSGDVPIILRMMAVLFYTVEFIRQNPEDFIRFLYNQVQLALQDGAYPLQRNFIRSAVSSCYKYVAWNEYAFTYLDANSETRYKVPGENGPAAVYHQWSQCKAECDRLIQELLGFPKIKWTLEATEVFRRGKYHYQIFNVYDACYYFSQALGLLQSG